MKLGRCCRFCIKLEPYFNRYYDEVYLCYQKSCFTEASDLDKQYCDCFEPCEKLKEVEWEE